MAIPKTPFASDSWWKDMTALCNQPGSRIPSAEWELFKFALT